MSGLTADQRAEWKRLADAATPAPWVEAHAHEAWAQVNCGARGYHRSMVADCLVGGDAAFVAAAREAVPALLAALAAAERDLAAERVERRCPKPHRLDELEHAGCAACAWRAYHAEKDTREATERERDEARAEAADAERCEGIERTAHDEQAVRAKKAEADRAKLVAALRELWGGFGLTYTQAEIVRKALRAVGKTP